MYEHRKIICRQKAKKLWYSKKLQCDAPSRPKHNILKSTRFDAEFEEINFKDLSLI